jgi:hypothetical protein
VVFDLRWDVAGETQLRRRFTHLERSFDDLREPFTGALGVIEDETRHQFGAEGDPAWAPLSAAYADRKQRRWGHVTKLIASGALALSLIERWAKGAIVEIEPDYLRRGTSLLVGKARKWNLGLLHQRGTRTMPARKPLRLRASAQDRILRIFRDWFWRQGEGAGT